MAPKIAGKRLDAATLPFPGVIDMRQYLGKTSELESLAKGRVLKWETTTKRAWLILEYDPAPDAKGAALRLQKVELGDWICKTADGALFVLPRSATPLNLRP